MRQLLLTLTSFLIAGLPVIAQPIGKQKLDSLFTRLETKHLAMGSIAISQNGQLVYSRAIGDAQIAGSDTVVADAATEYRIGSITKLFTAVMVFQLLEEKKLSLDDKLSAFFPQLPNSGLITIGNLLDHRSGLPDFTRNTGFDDWKEKPKTRDELLALVAGRTPDFAPNAKADYNNSNYLVLSFIIEKVCGKPYDVVLHDRVLAKLGLHHTYYAANPALSRHEASSYHYMDYKWTADKQVWLDDFKGAGAIISTPVDMLTFINALFTGRLVTPASLHTMETLVDGYGMGLFPFDFAGHPGFGHNGKTEGFASSLTYNPDDRIAIAYCTNGEVWSKSNILDAVRAIIFGQPYVLPDFSGVALPGTVLGRYVGRYRSASDGIEAVVTEKAGGLVLETRGKPFPLLAIDRRRFWNEGFGFFFHFDEEGKKLTIIDVETEYELARE